MVRLKSSQIAFILIVVVFVVSLAVSNYDATQARNRDRRTLQVAIVAQASIAQTAKRLAVEDAVAGCKSRNQIRGSVVAFIDELIAAARSDALAKLASPTSTASERASAQATIKALTADSASEKRRFGTEDCTKVK